MLKSLKSNSYRFVVVLLLLLTFLTVGVGKVIPVSALADPAPVPELAPVFDTQIYQLKDYVDENIIDTPKEPIFYLLMGAYLVSQAGMNQYELVDPYTTQDGVIGWLKSTGIQLYNSLVDFVPYDPVTGTDLKPLTTALVGYALGAAGLANSYTDETDFLNDVNNQSHYFLPFDQSLQTGINTVLGISGGLYEWQNSSVSPLNLLPEYTWTTYNSEPTIENLYPLQNDSQSFVRCNNLYNGFTDIAIILPKIYIFFDQSTYRYYLVDVNGNNLTTNHGYTVSKYACRTYQHIFFVYPDWPSSFNRSSFLNFSFYDAQFESLSQIPSILENFTYNKVSSEWLAFPRDYVKGVYYGYSWEHRTEYTLDQDLNFAENYYGYYLSVQTDYLLDLKGLISSLIGITSLNTQIISNLYDLTGTLVGNPSLVSVSINLPDNNPLPVNLNDIQLYTDNEYLDVVKERSLQASETIGEYVAFWHNCDPELVYAILGSFIVILIGAFIGKWGHS